MPAIEAVRHIPARCDMASCTNEECPSKQACWRFVKETCRRQTFSVFTVIEGTGRCPSFSAIEPSDWVDGPIRNI